MEPGACTASVRPDWALLVPSEICLPQMGSQAFLSSKGDTHESHEPHLQSQVGRTQGALSGSVRRADGGWSQGGVQRSPEPHLQVHGRTHQDQVHRQRQGGTQGSLTWRGSGR